MDGKTDALIDEVLEELKELLRYVNAHYRRAELQRQAQFIVAREKKELSGHDD